MRVLALLLAGVLAVVLITTLLAIGVDPHTVFLPGHLLRSGLGNIGVHLPNAAGVLTTGVVWWALIAGMWILVRRFLRRREARARVR